MQYYIIIKYILRNTSYHYPNQEFPHALGDDFNFGDARYSFTAYD